MNESLLSVLIFLKKHILNDDYSREELAEEADDIIDYVKRSRKSTLEEREMEGGTAWRRIKR